MGSKDKDYNYQSLFRCINNCGAEAKVQVGYTAKTKVTTHGLPSCCLTAVPPVVTLTNSSTKDEVTNANVDFDEATAKFGVDNCATHHLCGEKPLFIDLKDIDDSILVNGISGSKAAKGIGTVKFMILDLKGVYHEIVLENVVFLPGAVKNLISVSQWSRDRGDDAGVLTRGKFSYFMWDNDSHKTLIDHPPDCPIPLMLVKIPLAKQYLAFRSDISTDLIDKGKIPHYTMPLMGMEILKQTNNLWMFLPLLNRRGGFKLVPPLGLQSMECLGSL